MKSKLLFLLCALFALTASAQDILYWDFGGRNLGTGYKNMLPAKYLNAWSQNTVSSIGPEVDGNSVEYLNAHPIWASKWNNTDFRFQIASPTNDPDGIFLSGGSPFTEPADLPVLDDDINLAHRPDSNSDALRTIRPDITRYEERTGMPDGDAAFASHFPGCIEFTTSGTKRPDRGFTIGRLEAGQVVTIVGKGIIAEPEDGVEPRTGAFVFEQLDILGTPQRDVDEGNGPQDDSVRIIKFTAQDAGDYKLGYDFGKVRFYRIYLGDVNPDINPDNELIKVFDFGAQELDRDIYDNVASEYLLNDVLGNTDGVGIAGQDLSENSLVYDLAVNPNDLSDYLGLGENYYGNHFSYDFWFIHNSFENDRWRTSNPNLMDRDDNVGELAEDLDLTGRIYINSNGARDRYFSIRPYKNNQEVTIIFRGENVGSPSTINIQGIAYQNQPVGEVMSYDFSDDAVKALRVTLPTADVDYQIWDSVGKLSLYRVYMGNVEFPVVDPEKDNLGENNLSVHNHMSMINTDVKAVGNRIYISDVTSTTQVSIYNISGALIKTFEVNQDTDFEFNSGIWIAKIKSSRGEKAVKLLTY